MALLSERKNRDGQKRKIDRLRDGVSVSDVFEVSIERDGDPTSGLVVVLNDFPYRGPRRLVGHAVRIVDESGQESFAMIADAKNHLATISLFFKTLTKAGFPVGAKISLAD